MKTKVWKLQEAKSRFSEVVNLALSEGPQIVTRRGEEVVVILSSDEYAKLKKSEPSQVEFFRNSPLAGIALDLGRDRSMPGDLDL